MEVKTYTLFIYGTFEDHEEVEFFCMEIISKSPSVKTLRYIIENDNNIIVIFDSDYEVKKLSTELLTFMINDTIKYYFLFPLDTLVTAHLPEKLKDFIFKPNEMCFNIKV
jgi:viroplasmin and RNaseH domain-containing protein